MNSKPFQNLYEVMPNIATGLQDMLDVVAGAHVNYVLLTEVDNGVQYISGLPRPEGMKLLRSLLELWESENVETSNTTH